VAYLPHVLDQLGRHGLKPLPGTTPGRLRDALRDLYKYEIRRLRSALLARQFPRKDYAGFVLALRKRYWLLSVPIELWVVRDGNASSDNR
jgi:hypothetical protein